MKKNITPTRVIIRDMKSVLLYATGIVVVAILLLYFLRGNRQKFENFIFEDLGNFVADIESEIPKYGNSRQSVGPSEINFLGERYDIDWKRVKSSDDQISLNIPTNWRIEKDSSRSLHCLTGENEGSYFSILIHKKEELGISLSNYISYFLNTISEDTVEIFKIEEFSKAMNSMEDIYYVNLSSVVDSVNSETFSIVLENNNYIFDFSYRTAGSDISPLSKIIFFYVIHTINICGYYVLPKEVEIVEAGILWE